MEAPCCGEGFHRVTGASDNVQTQIPQVSLSASMLTKEVIKAHNATAIVRQYIQSRYHPGDK